MGLHRDCRRWGLPEGVGRRVSPGDMYEEPLLMLPPAQKNLLRALDL